MDTNPNESIAVGTVLFFAGFTGEPDEKFNFPMGERLKLIADVDGEGNYSVQRAEGDETIALFRDEFFTNAEWEAKQFELANPKDPAVAEDEEAAAAPDKSKAKGTVKKAAKKSAAEKATPAPAAEKPAKAAKAPKAAKSNKPTAEARADDSDASKDTGSQTTLPLQPSVETTSTTGDELEVTQYSSVKELLEEKDALEAAIGLVQQESAARLTLGGVLSHIQREGIHQRLGYDGKRGFEDYCDKALGVSYRKARYLIRTYDYFVKLGIPEEKFLKMGWSKAKELVGFATAENFEELREYAEENTRDNLKKKLRDEYEENAEERESDVKVRVKRMTLKFLGDQIDTVENAIAAAKKSGNTDEDAVALEYICGEWAMMQDGVETSVEDAIALLELKYGVTLQIVQPGEDNLPVQTDIEDHTEEQEAA